MDIERIAELLRPFLAPAGGESEDAGSLSREQLQNILTYINLLLRWNARMNLTAVREPEQMVTRHFGESFFAARHLFPDAGDREAKNGGSLFDLGSGAGFPGIPIKLWAPWLHVTLIESQQKKATFLREAARALRLTDINVLSDRAEDLPGRDPRPQADVVTLRAVEQFDQILPAAAALVAPRGRLALLIGKAQVESAQALTPSFIWGEPIPVPLSAARVLMIGRIDSGKVVPMNHARENQDCKQVVRSIAHLHKNTIGCDSFPRFAALKWEMSHSSLILTSQFAQMFHVEHLWKTPIRR